MGEPARVPQWTLGERMAKARRDAGLTQAQMSGKLGVSSAAVARWEAGVGQPRDLLKVMRQWSEITGAPIEWLLAVGPFSCSSVRLVPDPPGQGHLFPPDPPVRGHLRVAGRPS